MNIDKLTMAAQLILSVVILAGFGAALWLAWFAPVALSDARIRIIDTMVGVLGTLATMVATYWFARQRNAVAVPPEVQQ